MHCVICQIVAQVPNAADSPVLSKPLPSKTSATGYRIARSYVLETVNQSTDLHCSAEKQYSLFTIHLYTLLLLPVHHRPSALIISFKRRIGMNKNVNSDKNMSHTEVAANFRNVQQYPK
jgi:hypothetical protein